MAKYKTAIEWIANNDGNGDDERLNIDHVSYMVSVCLIADLFAKDQHKVGIDVIKKRKKMDKEENNGKD